MLYHVMMQYVTRLVMVLMEIIQYLVDNFSASENSTIAIITVCVVIYLGIKLLKWIVAHRGDIKSFFDNMYTRRQIREEMVEK